MKIRLCIGILNFVLSFYILIFAFCIIEFYSAKILFFNMPQPSEEIKSRLDIVDVIRDYIPVKAAGVNFRAKCPFHREKTPSFMISPDKQIWHCFGCGKGGDIFGFVMEMEGIDFVEALRLLAPKAGVTLKREDPKLSSQRNRFLDILEVSRRYFHRLLLEGEAARAAREYLKRRGLSEDTIEEWQVGYSPDSWDATLNMLKKSGFSENEIFLAGLVVNRNAGGDNGAGQTRRGFYDRFRGRIMFPINDLNGNTVAFSARVSPEKEATEKMGKYINSPQTMIYDKSRVLFGLDKARAEIKKADLAIIVEGQMDAITAHQHGFKNTVASSGTALTGEQTTLLKRYSANIALAFDMDEAGELAADRGIREAMRAEMSVRVIEVPSGKDPDECIRQNPRDFIKAVETAKPMMRYFFDKALAPLDLSEVDDRRQAAKKLLPVIAKLGNRIEQDHWLRELSARIDVKEEILRETLIKSAAQAKPELSSARAALPEAPAKRPRSREERLSELLLALILRFPVLTDYTLDHLSIEQIVGDENRHIYKNLILFYNKEREDGAPSEPGRTPNDSFRRFKEWLENNQPSAGIRQNYNANPAPETVAGRPGPNGQSLYLDRLAILGDNEFFDHTVEQAQAESMSIILILRKNYLKDRLKELEKMMAEAEKAGDSGPVGELMEEFKALGDELRELGE